MQRGQRDSGTKNLLNVDKRMPEQNNITGFAEKVSRYFLDFLETDFKRQQAPHRRIQLKNDSGFRTAVPLRKYQRLYTDIWGLLSSPVDQLQRFSLPQSRYTARISQNLKDLIRQHVDSLE